MAIAWAVKVLLFLILWLHAPTPSQGLKYSSPYRFPFIKKASSFSSSPSTSFTAKNQDSYYDYIIVGGGTAGCPLAATLSQNFSVLLLERGGVPFTNANVSFLSNFHITLADTSPTSASQAFVSTDGVLNARARVLGGGSSINAGFYTRASSGFVKRAKWDPKLVKKAYPWIERLIVHKPKLTQWQAAVRDSLLEIGIKPFNGFTYDHLYGTKVGGTIFDRFGRRHTAAELLGYSNPERLNVLIYATAQKIVFDTSGKRPRAAGVIFKDEKGNQHQALLKKKRGSEVIVSSGAIGSPQLLILSGIGPEEELKKFNIPAVLHNEFVGKGLADNPMNTIFAPSKIPLEQTLIQLVGITKKGVYLEASSGFGQSPDSIRCHHGIKSAEMSDIPPRQRRLEGIQAHSKAKKDIPHEVFQGGFILSKIARPLSSGQLTLNNTNVDDNPMITFNYFKHKRDLERCVEGVRLAAQLVQTERYLNYTQCKKETMEKVLNLSVETNVNLVPDHLNDTISLAQFCKDTVITIWHYHGGCHVGKVVSPDLKVLGVHRLSVIDGSTFHESPGTNPQGTVMMMGRYMGMKILRERHGKEGSV